MTAVVDLNDVREMFVPFDRDYEPVPLPQLQLAPLPRRHVYTVYVGGPMTNRPYFNFPNFDAVSEYCRDACGWYVFNPHEHDRETYPGIDTAEATVTGDVEGIAKEVGFSFSAAMSWDLARVIEADGIVLLPEWATSTGARAERFVAELTGKDVWLATKTGNAWDAWDIVHDPVQKRMNAATTKSLEKFEAAEGGSDSYPPVLSIPRGTLDGLMTPEPRFAVDSFGVIEDVFEDEHPMRSVAGGSYAPGIEMMKEVRVVDPATGGEKGSKLARFDLIPEDTMHVLAEHYGRGAEKYAARNWERGYAWSLSFAALRRHLAAWWQGEHIDDEGFEHLTAVLWHAAALRTFALRDIGTDDRP